MHSNLLRSEQDEPLNAITHLIPGIVFFLLWCFCDKEVEQIYTAGFSTMFFTSFFYHSASKSKRILRKLDQYCIYLIIGMSGLCCSHSIPSSHVVIILTTILLSLSYHVWSDKRGLPEGIVIPLVYLLSGLVCVIFILGSSNHHGWVIGGSTAYVVGFYFYLNDHKKYYHAIWHVFVVLGALMMFTHIQAASILP